MASKGSTTKNPIANPPAQGRAAPPAPTDAADEFQAYLERLGPDATSIAEALQEGAPVPETWRYSAGAWEALAAAAREHRRLKPLFDFAVAIAVDGYYPDELATGQLRGDAEVNIVTGRVQRVPEPTIPAALEAEAQGLLRDLHGLSVILDPIVQQRLENIAWGRWHGSPKTADATVAAARRALSARRAEIAAAARQERAKPLLRVRFAFQAGPWTFEAGEHRVDSEVVEQLREWQGNMEAQARQHDWDAPSGYSADRWPPFEIVADTAKASAPADALADAPAWGRHERS